MDEAVKQRKAQRLARKEQIAEMYCRDQTLEEIGAHFGLSRQRVQQILIDVNCPRRSHNHKTKEEYKKHLRLLPALVLRELFEERKLKILQICRELGTGYVIVRNSMDYYRIRYRTDKMILKLIRKSGKLTIEELDHQLHRLKLSPAEIAERFDVYPKFDPDLEIRLVE